MKEVRPVHGDPMRRMKPTPPPSTAPPLTLRRLQVRTPQQLRRAAGARIDDEAHREDEEAGHPDEALPWPQ